MDNDKQKNVNNRRSNYKYYFVHIHTMKNEYAMNA